MNRFYVRYLDMSAEKARIFNNIMENFTPNSHSALLWQLMEPSHR